MEQYITDIEKYITENKDSEHQHLSQTSKMQMAAGLFTIATKIKN